jgi:hypothetical protein
MVTKDRKQIALLTRENSHSVLWEDLWLGSKLLSLLGWSNRIRNQYLVCRLAFAFWGILHFLFIFVRFENHVWEYCIQIRCEFAQEECEAGSRPFLTSFWNYGCANEWCGVVSLWWNSTNLANLILNRGRNTRKRIGQGPI